MSCLQTEQHRWGKMGKVKLRRTKGNWLLREIVLNVFFDTCFVFVLQVFKSWCKSQGQRRQTERPIRTAPHLVWRDTEKSDPRAPLLPLTSQCLTSSTSSSSRSFSPSIIRLLVHSFFLSLFLFYFLYSFHPLISFPFAYFHLCSFICFVVPSYFRLFSFDPSFISSFIHSFFFHNFIH